MQLDSNNELNTNSFVSTINMVSVPIPGSQLAQIYGGVAHTVIVDTNGVISAYGFSRIVSIETN